uniref:ASXL transcriptional regulator 1 n=1 Tax=Tetraodon nigroviridis TaxID=99883 RepID=H3CFG5_TETNG
DMKDKQKRKKERTWAEAARMVLENFSDAPMTPKQILHVIQTKGLKEMRSSGTDPLACLVTMTLRSERDRVKNSIFFKLPGRMSLYHPEKNALQWTKSPSESEAPAGSAAAPVTPTEAAEQESCDSTETTATASGDNDASVDESSSSASCSTDPQTRLSRSRQSGRQRKKAVMMPRVVLTPLKVNGEHVPSGPMKRNRGGLDVDFETPGSILVNTNIRALINVRTFSAFPPQSQQQLLQLLPEVDRQMGPDGMARLSSSALNNEFFTHASQSWKERLAEGEFTHEMQVRLRFFEEYHGQKSGLTKEESLKLTVGDGGEVSAASVLDSDVAVVRSVTPKRRVGRRRRDGRMRRRTRADLRRRVRRSRCKATPPAVPAAEAADAGAALDVSAVSVGSPAAEGGLVQAEVVLQTEDGVELLPESVSAEPKRRQPRSRSANEEQEVPACLLPEEATPILGPAEAFATGLDSSSSSSASSSAAVAVDPLDDAASVVTSVTGTATSSRESSPSASPASSHLPSAQPKEQKRRPEESQTFSEKRPRLDDRQSFRTTIDGVGSEKPQPTAEEPKVPPIRIQLSRIKPPWVKGHPTYQICPRITLADIKARAQQARAQREAAAAVAASGDGPPPPGLRLRPAAGVPDSSSGRRTREHPGPIERGRVEEQGAPADAHPSGTQLQRPRVEPEQPPSPSPSTTSASLSPDVPQSPAPPLVEPADGCPQMQTSAQGPAGKSGVSPQPRTLPEPPSEGAGRGPEKPPLVPTSIPDSLPRFGAQGVDVTHTLACQNKDQVPDKDAGLGGVIQHSSQHVDPPEVIAGQPPPARLEKDQDGGAHSDSTETASDCENEGPEAPWTRTGDPRGAARWSSAAGGAEAAAGHPAPPVWPPGPQRHPALLPPPAGAPGPPGGQRAGQDGARRRVPAPPAGPGSLQAEPKARRGGGPARAVSTVEANNPLVQLLQGSLPLEKVLPPLSSARLEISRAPPPEPPGAPPPAPTRAASPPPGRLEAPAAARYQSQQPPGAVPVITPVPPFSSPSSSSPAYRKRPELSSQTPPETVVMAEPHGAQPPQGAAPDRLQRTTPNGPPPHGDPCPAEVVPPLKINWRPPPAAPLPPGHQQQLSPGGAVKSEAAGRPPCQALARSPPIKALHVPKKEPGSSMDSFLSGGAMEGLLNMEMTLARMAKKEQHRQLYGKLPISYTANVSVVDNGGFSRGVADGVLQLRPRQAEEVALKCSCRLKAMIMCQGCGAFCHDDCIGPSKLCVSCLVVR